MAKGILQGIQQFCQLEAEEFLGVEIGDAIAAIEGTELRCGKIPQLVQFDIGAVDVLGQAAQTS